MNETHAIDLRRLLFAAVLPFVLSPVLTAQDAALRRVLDLLIEWVERDPENSPNPTKSEVWAA